MTVAIPAAALAASVQTRPRKPPGASDSTSAVAQTEIAALRSRPSAPRTVKAA